MTKQFRPRDIVGEVQCCSYMAENGDMDSVYFENLSPSIQSRLQAPDRYKELWEQFRLEIKKCVVDRLDKTALLARMNELESQGRDGDE